MTFSEWWKSVAAHRMTWSRRMAAEYAWDAARADIEAVLVSKHGGEPLSLLAELDACRDLSRTVEREITALRARDKECAEVAIENAELRALVAGAQLDDGPCYYCGKQTNSLAGNPAEWCIVLSHADEPGVSKAHHAGCINERLAAATGPVEGRELELAVRWLLNENERTAEIASLLERLARERDEAKQALTTEAQRHDAAIERSAQNEERAEAAEKALIGEKQSGDAWMADCKAAERALTERNEDAERYRWLRAFKRHQISVSDAPPAGPADVREAAAKIADNAEKLNGGAYGGPARCEYDCGAVIAAAIRAMPLPPARTLSEEEIIRIAGEATDSWWNEGSVSLSTKTQREWVEFRIRTALERLKA